MLKHISHGIEFLFLFFSDWLDSTRRKLLDWNNRFSIIEGIAQVVLYLHNYSRLRIIHRGLKPSNILLDENMNPKISDFGVGMTCIFFSTQLIVVLMANVPIVFIK
ncbi:putative protein kinase RLK-Pelle-DLSV family [Medicago truncatula]|uniref:non-specific serine/threonine protein kinase n=1 Tax=Medicago truncatula TaxID=3880 RepID=A0A396GHQ7_MEDTR|nr:putative protein kinase RLK-Pelle-DLSV family [Medicago truncatula]